MPLTPADIANSQALIVQYTLTSRQIIDHLHTYNDDDRVTETWAKAHREWHADTRRNPILLPVRGEPLEPFLKRCDAIIHAKRHNYIDHIRAVFAASSAVQAVSYHARVNGTPDLSGMIMRRAGDEVIRRTRSAAEIAEARATLAETAREGAPFQRIGNAYTWRDSAGRKVELEVIDYSPNSMKEGGVYEIQYLGRQSPELLSSAALDKLISANSARLISLD